MSGKSRRWIWPLLAGGVLFQFQGFFALLPETLARIPFTAMFLPVEYLVSWLLGWLASLLTFRPFGL